MPAPGLRFRRRVLVVVLGVAALALLAGSCGQSEEAASLGRSTAPVLIPKGEWRAGFEISAPSGAADLYQLRWNGSQGSAGDVTGWQVALTSSYDESQIDGSARAAIDEVLRAARGERCEFVDLVIEVQLCAYVETYYLVRLVDDLVIVVDYTGPADRGNYDPESIEARFVAASFELVGVGSDLSAYLTTSPL